MKTLIVPDKKLLPLLDVAIGGDPSPPPIREWRNLFADFSWHGRLPKLRPGDPLPYLWHHEAIQGIYSPELLARIPFYATAYRNPTRPFGSPGTLLRRPRAVVVGTGSLAFPAAVTAYADANDIFFSAIFDGQSNVNIAGEPDNPHISTLLYGLPSSGNFDLSYSWFQVSTGTSETNNYHLKTVDPESFIGGEVLFITSFYDFLGEFDGAWCPYAYLDNIAGNSSFWHFDSVAIDREKAILENCIPRFVKVKWIHRVQVTSLTGGTANTSLVDGLGALPDEVEIRMTTDSVDTYYSNELLADMQAFFEGD